MAGTESNSIEITAYDLAEASVCVKDQAGNRWLLSPAELRAHPLFHTIDPSEHVRIEWMEEKRRARQEAANG